MTSRVPRRICRRAVPPDKTLTAPAGPRFPPRTSLPALGDVRAAGATVTELSEHVNAAYRASYPHANVDVVLVQSAGSTVAVLGEVRSPGAVPVTGPRTGSHTVPYDGPRGGPYAGAGLRS